MSVRVRIVYWAELSTVQLRKKEKEKRWKKKEGSGGRGIVDGALNVTQHPKLALLAHPTVVRGSIVGRFSAD